MVLRLAMSLVCVFMTTTSIAAPVRSSPSGFQPNKAFFGVGLSSNSITGSDNGTGFQFFGGYRFGEMARGLKLDGELGYMNTGDMDVTVNSRIRSSTEAKGLWATAIMRVAFSPTVDGLGRLGLDFGDDDGLMVGVGLGFALSNALQLRVEYVERDHVDSLQFNLVFW